ncbi:MAG TPA: BolA family protein [Alphaproteobacteria bacterium]|nr:BolA family protein [Alphaproteobacteria bacterium]
MYAERIRQKITAAFEGSRFTLTDESGKHAGHAGAHPDGETHFHLEVIWPGFAGVSPVARQRQVYALLADELKEHVHALSLGLKTPEEAAALSDAKRG